ncbi:hypothetical protein GGI35DRAFT_64260 [Trichoderma velutinum]
MTPVCFMRASSSVETISMRASSTAAERQKKPAETPTRHKRRCPAMVVWARTCHHRHHHGQARVLGCKRASKRVDRAVSQALQAPLASHVQWRRDHFPFGRWCGMQKCPAREGVCHAVSGAGRPWCDWLGGALRLKSEARHNMKGRENVAGGDGDGGMRFCDSFACLLCFCCVVLFARDWSATVLGLISLGGSMRGNGFDLAHAKSCSYLSSAERSASVSKLHGHANPVKCMQDMKQTRASWRTPEEKVEVGWLEQDRENRSGGLTMRLAHGIFASPKLRRLGGFV